MDCGDGAPGGRDNPGTWARLASYRGHAAGALIIAAFAALSSIGYASVKAEASASAYDYGYEYQYNKAHLIVIKHVVNDDSGTSTASDFTMTISGVTAEGGNSFAGEESPGTDKTVEPGSYSVSESGPAGYVTNFSADCSGTIAAGQTKKCTVTNNDVAPRRTLGFWKNHPEEIERLLPLVLGNYTVDTLEKALAILNDADCGGTDPIGCLAARLLVAELNLAHGSFPCITPTVNKANDFLSGGTVSAGGVTATGVNYVGPSGTYTLNANQKAVARTLGDALNKYNETRSKTNCQNP